MTRLRPCDIVLLPPAVYDDAKKAGYDMAGYRKTERIPMNKPNRPGINITRPTTLTKEQMVREMREAAANTAKVKVPTRKKHRPRSR